MCQSFSAQTHYNSQIKWLLCIFSSPYLIGVVLKSQWSHGISRVSFSLSLSNSLSLVLVIMFDSPFMRRIKRNSVYIVRHRLGRGNGFFLYQPSGFLLHCTKTQHVLFIFAILFRCSFHTIRIFHWIAFGMQRPNQLSKYNRIKQ